MQTFNLFQARKVEMSDDSELYEVVTPDGERIGATSTELPCATLAYSLNLVVSEWARSVGDDATVG